MPSLGFSLFAYFILYVEEEDIIHDKKIKFIEFLICICVSLYSQSFGYMFWILVFVGIALALALIPIGFIIFGIFFGIHKFNIR